MDQIRPIGPGERDIEPVYRVERSGDDQQEREQRERKQRQKPQPPAEEAAPEGPVEGDDGHLHIDIRA
jgi:hypothetical protein